MLFLKNFLKFEAKDLKAAVQVTIIGIRKKEGRRSDKEIGNQESNEFLSDCSSEELKAKVKQNEEKIKQHEEKFKQYDEENNELKQLLLILSPSD